MAVKDMNLMKLAVTKVQIAVSARIPYADQHHLYVQVDLHATGPSCERKRALSFGPVTLGTKGGWIRSPTVAMAEKTQKLVKAPRRSLEHSLKLKLKSWARKC